MTPLWAAVADPADECLEPSPLDTAPVPTCDTLKDAVAAAEQVKARDKTPGKGKTKGKGLDTGKGKGKGPAKNMQDVSSSSSSNEDNNDDDNADANDDKMGAAPPSSPPSLERRQAPPPGRGRGDAVYRARAPKPDTVYTAAKAAAMRQKHELLT